MKKTVWIALPLAILLFIGFLPSLLSSSLGASLISWYLSDESTDIVIHGVTFSWSAPQRIEKVFVKTKHTQMGFEQIEANTSFFSVLSGNYQETSINTLQITLEGLPEKQSFSKQSVQGNFTIHSLRIIEKISGMEFIAQQVSFTTNEQKLALYLNGESTSSSGRGSIALAVDITYPLFTSQTPFTMQCTINRLPTDVLSALIFLSKPEYAQLPSHLFGQMLTLELRADKQHDEILLSCKPYTSNLSGEVYARLSKGLFTLSRTSTLSGIITPGLLNPLIKKKQTILETPIHYVCKADRFAVPFKDGFFNWKKAALIATCETKSGRIQYDDHPLPVYLQEADITIRSDSLESKLSFSGRIEADYGKTALSLLYGSGTIQHPFSEMQFENIQLEAQQVPLGLLGECTGYPLSKYLGEYGSGTLNYNGPELHGEISTTLFKTTPFSFRSKGMYTLRSPVEISYLPPRALAEKYGSQAEISGTLSSLQVNPNNLSEFSGKGTFSIAPMQGGFQNHTYKIKGAHIEVEASSIAQINIQGNLQLQYTTIGFLQALFPTTFPLTFSASINGNAWDINDIVLSGETHFFSGKIYGEYSANKFQLKRPAVFRISPAVQLLNGNITSLSKDAPIIRTTSPWDISLSSFSMKEGDLSMEGNLMIQEITLETQNLLFPLLLQEVKTAFIFGKNTEFDFSGKCGNGEIECLIKTGERTSVSFSGNSIPTHTIDTLLGTDESFVPLLGAEASLTASFTGKKYCDEADITIEAPLLNGSLSLDRVGEIYTIKGHNTIHWRLTPEGYANIADPSSRMKLTTPATIAISFDKYTFPIAPHRFFPTKNEFQNPGTMIASLGIPSMHFLDTRSNEKVSLLHLTSSIHRSTNDAPLSFSLKSKVEGLKKEQKQGQITCSGTMNNYTLPNGKFSLEKVKLNAQGEITSMPSSLIDALLITKGSTLLPPSALFGPSVTMKMKASLNQGYGPLAIDISSPYFKADVDALVEKGTAFLEKPMTAVMIMTPRLSQALLGSVSVEALSIEKPIRMIISPRGFSIPLVPFSISKSQIGYGQIDLGQIIVRDTGTPTVVGDIFEIKKRPNTIHLWFAPLDFSIRDGYMLIDRTEILYDKTYDIAVWGNVDLINEYVNMTLGLTAQSLRQALGLRLPPEYVMQVPFKGPINNVKLDKGAAIAKIAFIIAREQGKQSNNIYGNLFGILGDLADDQSSVPPAKHPFPWEQ